MPTDAAAAATISTAQVPATTINSPAQTDAPASTSSPEIQPAVAPTADKAPTYSDDQEILSKEQVCQPLSASTGIAMYGRLLLFACVLKPVMMLQIKDSLYKRTFGTDGVDEIEEKHQIQVDDL